MNDVVTGTTLVVVPPTTTTYTAWVVCCESFVGAVRNFEMCTVDPSTVHRSSSVVGRRATYIGVPFRRIHIHIWCLD